MKRSSEFQGIQFLAPFLRFRHFNKDCIQVFFKFLELRRVALELIEIFLILIDELVLKYPNLLPDLVIRDIQLGPNDENKPFSRKKQEFSRIVLKFLNVRTTQFLVHRDDGREHATKQVGIIVIIFFRINRSVKKANTTIADHPKFIDNTISPSLF